MANVRGNVGDSSTAAMSWVKCAATAARTELPSSRGANPGFKPDPALGSITTTTDWVPAGPTAAAVGAWLRAELQTSPRDLQHCGIEAGANT